MIMITETISKNQSTILVTASTLIILAYSVLLINSPCLDRNHPFQRALQLYNSLGKANPIGQ